MKPLYALAALFISTVAAHDYSSIDDDNLDVSIQEWPQTGMNTISANALDGQTGGSVQVVSNVAHHRCAQPGHVTTIFDGLDVNNTATMLKSIKKQLEVSFFIPSPLLLDTTVIANGQAALRNGHALGLRFNPGYDLALGSLTEEKVNSELAIAETHFKKAFGRDLQYVLFAYGTPEVAYKVAEKRHIRPVLYNIDFSPANVNHIATLDANFVDPKHQSFITLQNSHNPNQWDTLRITYNAAVARNFLAVKLSTCLPPLRSAGVEAQAIVNNNPTNTPPNNPQPINNNNASNMATNVSVQSALVGCAIALAILVLA